MEGMRTLRILIIGLAGTLALSVSPAFAQEPKSAAPARELAKLLTDQKMDSVATRLPGSDDEFAGALVFSGQLIVVWAKYTSPAVLNEKLIRKEYRDVYIDLNAASVAATKHFVTDIGADGLKAKGGKNQPVDIHDLGNKSIRFDGNWREHKMSEDDYMKAHAEADAAYTTTLVALLAEMKKPS